MRARTRVGGVSIRTPVEASPLGEAVLRAAVVVAPHRAARYTQHNIKRTARSQICYTERFTMYYHRTLNLSIHFMTF